VTDLSLNVVDSAVLLVIAFALWYGFRVGFVSTAYSLASWILAVAAAFAFQGPATTLIAAIARLPQPVSAALGFMVVILVVESLFSITGYLAVRPIVGLIRRSRVDGADRVLGIVPSVVRSLFVVAIAIVAIEALPVSSEVKAAVETSRTGRMVGDQLAIYQPEIVAFTGQLGGAPLLVTKLGEDDTQKLDLPDGLQLAPDTVAEKQLFELVNEERSQRGLLALAWDDRLLPVARAHSEEMFKLKYFSHQSPVAGSPFDRLKAAGITYSRAGENLAYAQSVAIAHRALMDSPGHRENILRPEFVRIAIGVISAGAYGRMVTQLFITP